MTSFGVIRIFTLLELKNGFRKVKCRSEAYLGEAIVPWPLLWPKNFFLHTKKIGKLGLPPPPLCVSTSGQRKFAPTPLKS